MDAQHHQCPYVVTFCGVNSMGKSTNLAKISFWLFKKKKKSYTIVIKNSSSRSLSSSETLWVQGHSGAKPGQGPFGSRKLPFAFRARTREHSSRLAGKRFGGKRLEIKSSQRNHIATKLKDKPTQMVLRACFPGLDILGFSNGHTSPGPRVHIPGTLPTFCKGFPSFSFFLFLVTSHTAVVQMKNPEILNI